MLSTCTAKPFGFGTSTSFAASSFLSVAYALCLLPIYSSSSLVVKIIVVALVHPAIVFFLDITFRVSDVLHAARTQTDAIERSIEHIDSKMFFSVARRFMLLGVGDTKVVFILIFTIFFEDTLMRCGTRFFDNIFRSIFRQFKPGASGKSRDSMDLRC